MGGLLSTPPASPQNPSDSPSSNPTNPSIPLATTDPAPSSPKNPSDSPNTSMPSASQPQNPLSHDAETKTLGTDPAAAESSIPDGGEAGEEGEEAEQGECGFCLFMKGGGCREAFINWENCVEDAERNEQDVVDKCYEVTGLLKKCMEEHSDYYEPILGAERAAEEAAKKELEREKAASESDQKDAPSIAGDQQPKQDAAATDKKD